MIRKRDRLSHLPDMRLVARKAAVGVSIVVVVALIHAFRIGALLEGRLFTLYYSYFSDIIVPFAMYFLLCVNDLTVAFLRDWKVKAGIIFGVSTFSEVLQAFGVPLLGLTFDPLDIGMFAVGVGLAVMLDRLVFAKHLSFWSRET